MKSWRTAPNALEGAKGLSEESKWPLAAAAILYRRGLTTAEQVDRFVNPRLSDLSDPGDLPDMQPAVDRIAHALRSRERITVFGDYDVDGITSAALLSRTLRAMGGQVSTFIPHRENDGYGLHVATVKHCLDTFEPGLLLTVDCGTGSAEAVRYAASRNVDVVITDHHDLSGELAPAVAVINPKRNPSDLPWSGLCGVGVAFKLCDALVKAGRLDIDLREDLDLVALGTIADVVPLTGENRILVRHGLARLQATTNPGLQALLRICGVKGEIGSYHVGFMLAPRLNVAGRLGTAERALELMLTEDPAHAEAIASELNLANLERRKIENEACLLAEKQVSATFDPQRDFGLVVYSPDWHPGIIGIVASRLVARYHRPVVVVTTQKDGRTRGSSRSIEGFNLVEALDSCSDTLLRHGGHAMAAGIEIDRLKIDAFREKFSEAAATKLRGLDLQPVQLVEEWVTLAEVDDPLLKAVESMHPFGIGNPSPVFASTRLTVLGRPRVVGERHLAMTLLDGRESRDVIGFRMADRTLPDGPLDAAFTIQRRECRGRQPIQLVLQDFRPSSEPQSLA